MRDHKSFMGVTSIRVYSQTAGVLNDAEVEWKLIYRTYILNVEINLHQISNIGTGIHLVWRYRRLHNIE